MSMPIWKPALAGDALNAPIPAIAASNTMPERLPRTPMTFVIQTPVAGLDTAPRGWLGDRPGVDIPGNCPSLRYTFGCTYDRSMTDVVMASRKTARSAGLKYVGKTEEGIHRVRSGHGFVYRTSAGRPVKGQ